MQIFDKTSGALKWAVDTDGYEIVHEDNSAENVPTQLEANFYRPDKQEAAYVRRGVVRRKGGELRKYEPMTEAPGIARRLAEMYVTEPLSQRPSDEEILDFVGSYGLLVEADAMAVRDLIYTAKYLQLFAQAIDGGKKRLAREVFNERVMPRMTVRLVGSKSGRPTANWNLEVAPTTLFGVAWLQMAQELTQGKKLKKCDAPDCLEWFPDRSNKRFCKNRCKMAYHKNRSK
jgi:predicted RNA-binding Zn ribbon-like protein|tara:strand:- start:154 stop:846 length:693 start_codon:yes stop_codon:yes gene_type:complete